MRSKVLLTAALVVLSLACSGAPDESDAALANPEDRPYATTPDGIPIAYSDHGEGEPTLVFVHGWLGNRNYWAGQVMAFAGKYRVVTLDLAGHGESGTGRTDWATKTFGEDIRAVVEQLDLERVILVGHSLGGIAVLEAARLMPERTLGVIGVDTLHDADFKFDDAQLDALLAQYESQFQPTCAQFVRAMFAGGTSDPTIVERTIAGMCAAPPEIAIPVFAAMRDYDMPAAMREVKAPIRCINSARHPTNVEGNRAYSADFKAVAMEGVAHFPMFDQPDEFNQVLSVVVTSLVGAT
ncbi:MAG: alpha/beta hydrolase [bacterium]|nr:alpha/beta hydrolase [bacterium]